MEPIEVQCPYCWSWFEAEVDTSAGNRDYVEYCPVCCQPIHLAITVAEDGCVQSVEATRSD